MHTAFTLSFNQIFNLKVKIFFTLGPSGVRVGRCLNRMNYNEDDGDDDEGSDTEEGMFYPNVNDLVWILGCRFGFRI